MSTKPRTIERRPPVRRRVLSPRTDYRHQENEAVGSTLWDLLSNPVAKRKAVAEDFASAMAVVDGVAEVWSIDFEKDLELAVILDDPEVEIEVREIFIDLVCSRLNASEGELRAFIAGQVPDWVSDGISLL